MPLQGFQHKSISHEPIGNRIKAARKKNKISLQIAEHETKIRAHYLEAIENNNFGELPSSHRKGFIRRYAEYVGISDIDTNLLADTELHRDTSSLFSPKKLHKETSWVITPKVLISILVTLLIIGFVGYVGYQVRRFAAPPTLEVTKPANESVVTEESATIEGATDAGASVFIDNLQVSVDSSGHFAYPIVLRPGLNKLSIRAVNTIKKETTKTLSILYQGTQPSASPSSSLSPSPSASPSPTSSPR